MVKISSAHTPFVHSIFISEIKSAYVYIARQHGLIPWPRQAIRIILGVVEQVNTIRQLLGNKAGICNRVMTIRKNISSCITDQPAGFAVGTAIVGPFQGISNGMGGSTFADYRITNKVRPGY